jgi:hypothetical protein
MQDELKKLGSLSAIEYFLNLDGLMVNEDIESLKRASSTIFKPSEVFMPTIKLLSKMGYIEILENRISKKKSYNKLTFITDYIIFLNDNKILSGIISTENLKFDSDKKRYIINNNTISLIYESIRNFLIDADFLSKSYYGNDLYINVEFNQLTEEIILPSIESEYKKSGRTPSQFKNDQLKNEENGLEAEIFVMAFEKKRLHMHTRVNDIQHVALFNVGAGFDILSFSTNESFILDREIEVKSYVGNPHFFISKNEYDRAKKNHERYYIYLVDRDRLQDEGYCPELIENPYKNLFKSDEWTCEIDKYHYIKK